MMRSTEETTAEEEAAAADEVCASCGKPAVDDVKLKKCNGGCGLVKYCSDGCQELHRHDHAGDCKKRLAEIRDRDLFTMPDGSHLGECPLCCLPLSIDPTKSTMMPCCSKWICNGCQIANINREMEAGLEQRCAFCREPTPKSDDEAHKKIMKRIKENNDPAAMCFMGKVRNEEGDYETAFKYYTKAAGLGNAEAHYGLSCLYRDGDGVVKDKKKEMYHLEEAAIGGDPDARHNLGAVEANNGRYERAKKHFIIAANLGDHDSLEALRHIYANGYASKEDYAGALRAYQAAVEATKSSEREKAEEAMKLCAALDGRVSM
jgi:tetratricopeptide (TPR) repeat protein